MVTITLKVDPSRAALADELSRRDGDSGRNAVLRKALDRLIETELDTQTRKRVAREMAAAA
jgi:hypothetical protein